MGTWGVSPIENDHISDWLQDLEARGMCSILEQLHYLAGQPPSSYCLDYIRILPYVFSNKYTTCSFSVHEQIQVLSVYGDFMIAFFLEVISQEEYFSWWREPTAVGEQLKKDWNVFCNIYTPAHEYTDVVHAYLAAGVQVPSILRQTK